MDGHIHELWWDAIGGWGSGDLTAVTGAPPAAGDPAGDAFEAEPTQHVVYRSADGHVHAAQHRSLDVQGVQFHPESVLTPQGENIMRNWLKT